MILHPEIRPYQQHRLQVEVPHELYIEESGSPEGIPVIVLHGGPGGSSSPFHRRFFDPDKYRIILFDQRGAGKSTPPGELKGNNTQALIDDIEKIRELLNVEKMIVFGGSWGATLALLYAQAHPDRVMGLILRGVFLAREKDISWLYESGANRIFPDAWQEFVAKIPENERSNLVTAYHERLNSNNEISKMAAAKAWAAWEGHCSTLKTNFSVINQFIDPRSALKLARIETHFFKNQSFIKENQILDNINIIEEIPGIIVHGRYDMVCTLESAFALNNVWKNAELHIVRDAGHSSTEEGIVSALVRASAKFADFFESRK